MRTHNSGLPLPMAQSAMRQVRVWRVRAWIVVVLMLLWAIVSIVMTWRAHVDASMARILVVVSNGSAEAN